MALHPVVGAHNKHRIVQRLQRALRLRREVDVARSVEQHYVRTRPIQRGLLRKNRDTALAFHGVRVEVRIALVHAPLPANCPRSIQKGLRQRSFARIDVGDKTYHGLGHGRSSYPCGPRLPAKVLQPIYCILPTYATKRALPQFTAVGAPLFLDDYGLRMVCVRLTRVALR